MRRAVMENAYTSSDSVFNISSGLQIHMGGGVEKWRTVEGRDEWDKAKTPIVVEHLDKSTLSNESSIFHSPPILFCDHPVVRRGSAGGLVRPGISGTFHIWSLQVTCAEISMVLTYFQLTSEDYHWWWRSFNSSAFSGVPARSQRLFH